MSPHLAGNCFLWAPGSKRQGYVVTIDVSSELNARINELLNDELLILAEASTGESVEHAVRPLSDAERASGVRFGDIEGIQDALLETVAPAVTAVMVATAGAVVAESRRVAMAATILNVLDQWRTSPPAVVAEAVEKAAAVVDEALAVSYRESARLVVAEAARQGVAIQSAETVPAWTQTQARVVANSAADKVLGAAHTVYEQPRAVITLPAPEEVQEAVTGLSDRAPIDKARQANHAVVNEARFETVANNEPKPAYHYSSELLDGNTCSSCAKIDGTEWTDLSDARKAYPGGGGHVNCAGGPGRCRGTLVHVWED